MADRQGMMTMGVRAGLGLLIPLLLMACSGDSGSGTPGVSATAARVGAAAQTTTENANAPGSGLTLIRRDQISPRLIELYFKTTALDQKPRVRVLLPTNYDPATRYPVLYLLHGSFYNCTEGGTTCILDWISEGHADELTEGLPVITVLIDSAAFGFYTDWWNFGQGGTPKWATFHIDQLVPYIDANFPTIAERGQRALAGLSMGGFGTTSYAARYPDLFVAAASFSGAVDNTLVETRIPTGTSGLPKTIWGFYETDEVRWRGDNPPDLARNLAATDISLYTGNGLPGGPNNNLIDPIEILAEKATTNFHDRLDALRIAHRFDDYGPGDHSFYYWMRDMRDWLPHMMAVFAEHRKTPTAFTFASVRPSYSAYGWTVATQRSALEFGAIKVESPQSFEVTGSGSASVTTAPVYTPQAAYTVRIAAENGTTVTRLVASAAGTLTIPVPLGPANRYQQFSPLANAAGLAPGASAGTADPPFTVIGNGSRFFKTVVSVTASPS